MEGINKKYNLEIEVLTPLSIGAGAEKDWVRGVDFVVDNGKLYKLNLKKMLSCGIRTEDLTSLFASKNEEGLKSLLAGKLEVASDFSIPFPAESDNDVKTFVKNQLTGNAVLTGSSLKGSIRSVLFQYLGGESKDGKEVFGSSTNGDEFLRFIKISDAEFSGTELVNTKIFNLKGGGNSWHGGWKHAFNSTNSHFNREGFNTIYECLTAGQKSKCTISLSIKLFENYGVNQPKYAKKKELFSDEEYEPIENLFYEVNSHTYDYLKKELEFFKYYDQAERSKEIIDTTKKMLHQTNDLLEENKSCILKMSAGSGFHSITGDWQFDDYSINGLDTSKKVSRGLFGNRKSAKSRKIAEWNGILSLMGFVKLSIVE
ncbi:MAG: hypothetical protein IJJ78_06190 [Paludibacteraceae bacterium]|nr:hypothetical protein [Paludibacteraceae bacterium]